MTIYNRVTTNLALAGVVFSISWSMVAVGSPPIRFATGLIEPYQILDEKKELTGSAIPIIRCVMTALGHDYTIEVLPWARAQKNVELGHNDAFFVASKNQERDAYAEASSPLFSGKRSWVFRSGFSPSTDIDAEEFRKNGRVGSIFGTNMHAWLKENYSNVVAKRDEKSLYDILHAGRVDAVLITDAMFAHMMSSNQHPHPHFASQPHTQNPLGVYFGKKYLATNPKLLNDFNRALPECLKPV